MPADRRSVTTVTTDIGSPHSAGAGSELPKQVVTVVTRDQNGRFETRPASDQIEHGKGSRTGAHLATCA